MWFVSVNRVRLINLSHGPTWNQRCQPVTMNELHGEPGSFVQLFRGRPNVSDNTFPILVQNVNRSFITLVSTSTTQLSTEQ